VVPLESVGENFVVNFPETVPSNISISMSGVGAQGGPRTATTFCSNVRPHLLYSASSSVLQTTQYLTSLNLIMVAWFHKNVYLRDEIAFQLKPSPLFFPVDFLCSILVPQELGVPTIRYIRNPINKVKSTLSLLHKKPAQSVVCLPKKN
jgi:hypothetical protein